jgi:hypothetical protein
MKLIVIAGMAATSLIVATGCATVCPSCQPLPAQGEYSVCDAAGVGAQHLQVGDQVVIGRIGNVTNVTLARRSGEKTELQLFQGTRGLVGWIPKAEKGAHENHVLTIATARVRPASCTKGSAVISIEFVIPDSDQAYRGARSSPHYGHIHAEN